MIRIFNRVFLGQLGKWCVLSLLTFIFVGSSLAIAQEKPFEGVTIHVAMVDEPRERSLKDMTSEFEEETGIKVVIDLLGFEPLYNKLLVSSQAKTGEYDVMQPCYMYTHLWVSSGWSFDLTEWVKRDADWVWPEDIHPSQMDTHINGGVKGKWYGMPMHSNATCFFYRKDIFQENGFSEPKNWDEVVEIAKKINAKYAPEMYGITFMGKADVQLGCEILSMLGAYGEYIYDKKTYKPTVNTPTGIKVFQLLKELTKYAPPGVGAYALDENYNSFAQGKAAMTIAWTTGYTYFEDPATSKISGKWEAMPCPGGGSVWGGWALQVSESSRHKEAAWEWIKWATSPKMEWRLLGNMESPRTSVLTNPWVQKNYPNNRVYYELVKAGPIPMPLIENSFEILQKAARAGSEVIIGTKEPEQAANELQEELTRVMEMSGYYNP